LRISLAIAAAAMAGFVFAAPSAQAAPAGLPSVVPTILAAPATSLGLTDVQFRRHDGYYRGWRGHRGYHRGGRRWGRGVGPFLGGLAAGAVIGGAFDRRSYGYSGSSDAYERCAARFKSFEPSTGTYTTYGGETRRCPYL